MRDSLSPLLGICSLCQEVRFTFAVHELDSLLAEAWSSAFLAVDTFLASPLHGMPGTVADFVSKQSGSLWQEARNSGTGPQWGATVFYLLSLRPGQLFSGC